MAKNNGVYHGLMMGCAREFWGEIMYEMYQRFGNRPFLWNELMSEKKIGKSELSRLRASGYIVQIGKVQSGNSNQKKTGVWRLNYKITKTEDSYELVYG